MNKAGRFTLAIIKPDIFLSSSPSIVPHILKTIKDNGFDIVSSKRMHLSTEKAQEFYAEHRGKFFFQRLVYFMSSGEIMPLILYRYQGDAISKWRSLTGPTNRERALSTAPGSIRSLFGFSDTRNAVHGSDSIETAVREIDFFFPHFFDRSEEEICSEIEKGRSLRTVDSID